MHILSSNHIKISMLISSRPIGIIDSGIGGLTLCSAIHKKYPQEDIIYVADDQFMPYGNKSKNQILDRLINITDNLIENYNIKILILACNTATLTGIRELKIKYKIPIIGVHPEREDGFIICTKLSAKQITKNKLYVKNLASKIEQDFFNSDKLEKYINKVIKKYNLSEQSRIVLGCTHYELIKKIFEKYLPKTQFLCPSNQTLIELDQIYTKYFFDAQKRYLGQIFIIATSGSKAYKNKLNLILEKEF